MLIDLHRHLDGNIRPSTVLELGLHYGIDIGATTLTELLPLIQCQQAEPDLLSFLQKLDTGVSVLTSLDDCKRVAYENVEDLKTANIDYAELRFSPYYMAKSHGLETEAVVEAVLDGIALGKKEFGIECNAIGILSRTFGVQQCMFELDALLEHAKNIVAIDLAGDEAGFPAPLFIEHFQRVRQADLNITIHAGEAASQLSIWQSIELLGATRIGHGVAAIHDLDLMNFMAKNDIGIESCLTSNILTGTHPCLATHPVLTFIENEIPVCINTDDPAIQGIELAHEFDIVKSKVRLSDWQIKQLKLNAINMAFIPNSHKARLKQKLEQEETETNGLLDR